MFAAHCGSVGSHWDIRQPLWNDMWATSYYGKILSRHTDFDGAIVGSNSFYSYQRIWVGSYDSYTSRTVEAVAISAIGSEICYSGSFSGQICGNIVTAKDVFTNIGDDLINVQSIKTTQFDSIPAIGHGDSGGPGYIYSKGLQGSARWATSIISSMPVSSWSSTCSGVPGGEGEHDRKCSPVAYSTEVWRILEDSGWSLKINSPTY